MGKDSEAIHSQLYTMSKLTNVNVQFPLPLGFLGSCLDGTSEPATRKGKTNQCDIPQEFT